jgi:hypothetical protein
MMDPANRNAAIAAAIILIGFGLFAFYLPDIMFAAGKVSTVAAGLVVVVFLGALFAILWLRARSQRGG